MSTSTRNVRTLVAGAGTGGLTAFGKLREASIPAVLCDGGPLGTTCARVGCMPSKALIEMSWKAHEAQELYRKRFLPLDVEPQFNFLKVMEHVRYLRDHFVRSIEDEVEAFNRDFISSNVHFESPTSAYTEDGTLINFESAIIAVGSSPVIPTSFAEQQDVFTSDTIFDINEPIGSLEVIGCGVVGLELAQAISRLGVKVRVYCEDLDFSFLPDEELTEIYIERLKRDFTFISGFEVHHTGRGKYFQLEDEVYKYEACLLATGRRANLEPLNLGKAIPDIMDAMEKNGIKARGLPFYFVGDANGRSPTVHDAILEGKIAAAMIEGESPIQVEPLKFNIVFTDPQVAIIENRRFDGELREATLSLKDQGRLILAGENYGCIKFFYEPKSEVIRKVYIVSSQAEHLAHYLYPLLKHEAKLRDIRRSVFYHPTIYEVFTHTMEEEMPRHKNYKNIFKSPEDKISDTKPEVFEKNNFGKVDHDTMSRHSRADVIDQREKGRARDSI